MSRARRRGMQFQPFKTFNRSRLPGGGQVASFKPLQTRAGSRFKGVKAEARSKGTNRSSRSKRLTAQN